MKRKAFKIIGIILIACLVIIGWISIYRHIFCDPHFGTEEYFCVSKPFPTDISREQATKDIDFVMKKLRSRHPAWLEDYNNGVNLAEKHYAEVLNNLADDMTVFDVYKDLCYIIAPLGDGHTYINSNRDDVKMLDDTSYLAKYGYPVKINGIPSTEVAEEFLKYQSYEIESIAVDNFLTYYVCYEPCLWLAGIDTVDGVILTYLIDNVETDVHHDFIEPMTEDTDTLPDTDSSSWVSFDIDKEHDLAVFTLTQCIYDDEYINTVKSFFTEVEKSNISNIAIDLRGNSGGNSQVANEFLHYCGPGEYRSWDSDIRIKNKLTKSRDYIITNTPYQPYFTGDIYVMTDRNTYSSAAYFTMLILDNNIGTIVGEASSNIMDSYGDCLFFRVPNTRLNLSVSYKRWYRIDKSKSGLPLTPDYECDPEKALEKVHELIAK